MIFETDDPQLIKVQQDATNDPQLTYTLNLPFENGSVYTGYLKGTEGLRHGPGVQIWPDNAKYEGEWKDNMAHGKGKFWHADGDIYCGEWKEDKANGYGVYQHLNGAQYEGEWIDDLQDGQGMESW